MKFRKRTYIFITLCLMGHLLFAQGKDSVVVAVDSAMSAQEVKAIEGVISSGPSDKENVDFLSQVTKYGFKNLFKNYTYNPLIPYSQQINPYAENYMQDYLRSHTEYLKNLGKNSTTYFNLIDGILSQYGLPHELKYLAVIESDLKSYALSVAGARGPWQFMPGTARGYGLRVDNTLDERTDYTKSTHAAAKYLLKLYKDLNDWLLVIAAYNGGPGRVYSAIRKSGSRDFWKLQYYLPEESRNHVKKFIATHFIMENGNQGDGTIYSQDAIAQNIPDSLKKGLQSEMISGRFKASIIAKETGMELSTFTILNPQMENVLSAGASFKLQLPKEKMELFKQHKYEILNHSVDALLNDVKIESKVVFRNKGK